MSELMDERTSPTTSGWRTVGDELGTPAGPLDERGNPTGGIPDVLIVLDIAADAWNSRVHHRAVRPIWDQDRTFSRRLDRSKKQ